jgi:predicted Zn-dependent protease
MLWKMDRLAGYAANQIPVEWETKLGESITAQYRITNNLMPKEEVSALVKPLTSPLINALNNSPYKYDFTIVNDGSLNAFALPGGFVTIHSGLILKAESAEELLGVLAHEINHVEKRHGLRSIAGNAGIYMLASVVFGDVSGLLALVANAAPMLMSQTYSRGFETEADENAVELMKRANINPEGLPRFFEKMIAEEKAMFDKIENEQAKAAYKTAMTFLSTHPASEKRMTHLRELIGNNSHVEYMNQDAEFKALKDAVKKFVENAPSAITSKPSDAPVNDSSSSESSSEPGIQTKKDELPQL